MLSQLSWHRGNRLPFSTWSSDWVKSRNHLSNSSLRKMTDWIEQLRSCMSKVNRPFAYRVAQGMLEYAANYPSPDKNLGNIISDQIEQKILPRLRGIDPTGAKGREAFEAIKRILGSDTCKDDLLIGTLTSSSQDNYFQWSGLDRAKEGVVDG